MIDQNSFLEMTWEALLSRKKAEVLRAYNALDVESQKAVEDHLNKMATEEGWHPEQVKSAKSALRAIRSKEN